MKSIVSRIPRKLLLILAGVTVLGGGSGAAAVYIGADKLLGPSYDELNGLACTTVQTVRIKKADRYWIRKYVTTDKPGDGMSRLKTALRVAQSVQSREQSDLVQVTVLDPTGPTDRSRMRGRAIGAQVVYIPDTTRVPQGSPAQPIVAYYVDGAANASGEFWGMRFDLPREDVEHLSAALTDDADCADPVVEGAEGHGSETSEGRAAGHGDADGKRAHGGEKGDGHDATPSAEGHDTPGDDHGEDTPVAGHEAEKNAGLIASLMGMVGLGGADAPAGIDGTAPVHDLPADDLPEPGHVTAAGETERAEEHAAVEAEAGWLDAFKGMVGLGAQGDDPDAGAEEPIGNDGAAAHAEEPEAAHGAATEGTSLPAETKAGNHGADWLAKMRAQPLSSGEEAPPTADKTIANVEPTPVSVVAEEDDPEKHRRKPKPQETH